MDPILEQFLSEARDNLDYLDSHLQDLKDGDSETVNSLFRSAHTLKGGAGLVGLVHIKEVTHVAEDLLDAYRNGKIEYSDKMLDALYEAFDEVIELVDAVEESGNKDIEADEEVLQRVKDDLRAFLKSGEKEQTKEPKLPFALDETLSLDRLTDVQLERVLPLVKGSVRIDEEFISQENYWVIDMNLAEDTIELGNDPFYLVSMLGEENVAAIITYLYNPHDISNPLALKTRMKVVCRADVESLEDIFYNVIDEILAYPLVTKVLLNTDSESVKNDTFDTLLQDIKSDGKKDIVQKLKTALNVINPETKEGFLVERILNIVKIDDRFLGDIFKDLDLGISEKERKLDAKEADSAKNADDNKEKMTVLNILKSQLIALNSDGAFERVKFVLKSVVAFLDIEKRDIDEIEDVEKLKEFIDSMIGTLQTQEFKEEQKTAPKREESVKSVEKKESAKSSSVQKHHASIPKTVKIDQDEIDALMDIVGEILVVKNSLPYVAESINPKNSQTAKRELLNKYEEISRITDQLQDRGMGMRLLPLSYIFNRYPKLVRDMSKKLDKKIEYKEYGSETKLDKMMIEKLADPLVHIIRNSLDHGLETVGERVEAGKSESGVLVIGAKSEGDRVFIEIKDDGKGIDMDRVINVALQKRLIDPDKIDGMSESEKLGLIFLPGLSTKEKITDLSGRGVGADAVKTTVDELGGKIDIKSKRGEGTTIVLELPVSVALTNLFQIKMADENYAVSMESVIETDKISKGEIQTANHSPFIRLRENIIPLVLSKTLLKRDEFRDEENIIIVKVANTQVALVADELVGQIDVVQKPLSGMLKNHPYINGTSLLGNGEPLFVIKPEAFFEIK